VISYHFPPDPGVASVRLRNLVLHLGEHGWRTSVVAGPPPTAPDETLEAGRGTSVLRLEPRRLGPSLQGADWAAAAVGAARRAAGESDAVLISGGPFAPFVIGPLLGRPYVLDFRDPWSWEPRFRRLERRLRRRAGAAVERVGEAAAVARAAACITVCDPITERYRMLYPRLGRSIETIEHGWEPGDFSAPSATGALEVLYAGTFLPRERTPELSLDVARRVRDSGIDLRVRLVGHLPDELRVQTADAEAEGWLAVEGVVSHARAIEAMRSAAVLWAQPGELDFLITGKVYEYLASGRPIVAVAPAGGGLARLLERTGGAFVVGNEPAEAAHAVQRALDGDLPIRNEAEMSALAAPRIAERLARILDWAVA
jgi:glycosyltransferase involved in cell wall biosynthesis